MKPVGGMHATATKLLRGKKGMMRGSGGGKERELLWINTPSTMNVGWGTIRQALKNLQQMKDVGKDTTNLTPSSLTS